MTSKTKSEIKSFFETGDKPNQAQFEDFIDSYVDKNGPIGDIETLASANESGIAFVSGRRGEVINANSLRTFSGITVYTSALTDAVITDRIATTAQAVSGESTTRLITPSLLTSKFASTVQAVSGLATGLFMDPVLVRNAIAAQSSSGSAGWVPISTKNAANDSSIDFVNGSGGVVFDGTYKAYALVFSSVRPASDGVYLRYSVSDTGSGGSFSTLSANTASNLIEGTSTYNGQSSATSNITEATGNLTSEAVSGTIFIFDPASTAAYKNITYTTVGTNDSGSNVGRTGVAQYRTANALTGFRLVFNTGNIDSGTFTLYGLKSA